MRRMLDDHKDGVSDFRKVASSARDNDVKMFAAQTLPTLEEHLRLAQQFDQANRETRGTTGALPPDPHNRGRIRWVVRSDEASRIHPAVREASRIHPAVRELRGTLALARILAAIARLERTVASRWSVGSHGPAAS